MRRAFLTLLLFTFLGAAQAGGVPIRSLLTGSGGQISTGSKSFVVVKRTRDLKPFHLMVIVSTAREDRILDLILAVKLTRLSAAEMELFKGNASYVATRCFGLDAQALPNFSAWLEGLNADNVNRTTATFGKLKAVFVRQNTPDAPYTTVELYRDTDQPGVKPWVNYCTR